MLVKGMSDLKFCSYARLYEPLSKKYATDCGWGCTVRNFQSLLCNAIWRSGGDPSLYVSDALSGSPFAFNKIIQETNKYGGEPGRFFATSVLLRAIVDICHECRPDHLPFDVMHGNDLLDLQGLKAPRRRPVLALFQLRLGLGHPSRETATAISNLFKSPGFLGAVGGRGEKSFLFVSSTDKNELVYLDPHCFTEDNAAANFKLPLYQVGFDMKPEEVDPNMSVAFLVEPSTSIDTLLRILQDDLPNALVDLGPVPPCDMPDEDILLEF